MKGAAPNETALSDLDAGQGSRTQDAEHRGAGSVQDLPDLGDGQQIVLGMLDKCTHNEYGISLRTCVQVAHEMFLDC